MCLYSQWHTVCHSVLIAVIVSEKTSYSKATTLSTAQNTIATSLHTIATAQNSNHPGKPPTNHRNCPSNYSVCHSNCPGYHSNHPCNCPKHHSHCPECHSNHPSTRPPYTTLRLYTLLSSELSQRVSIQVCRTLWLSKNENAHKWSEMLLKPHGHQIMAGSFRERLRFGRAVSKSQSLCRITAAFSHRSRQTNLVRTGRAAERARRLERCRAAAEDDAEGDSNANKPSSLVLVILDVQWCLVMLLSVNKSKADILLEQFISIGFHFSFTLSVNTPSCHPDDVSARCNEYGGLKSQDLECFHSPWSQSAE